jgi:hypothetical protein
MLEREKSVPYMVEIYKSAIIKMGRVRVKVPEMHQQS